MKIACLQVAPLSCDVQGNLARLQHSALQAKEAGCDLLVTPEMYLTGYNIGADAVARLAQPRDGDDQQKVADIARDAGLAILYGYPERHGDKIYNSVQLLDQTGRARGNYRKTHLYGQVDRDQFSAGTTRSAVITLNGWQVALAICYDIEFAELSRAYALDGAEIILTPTANMTPYVSIAQRIVPTRAEENGIFVVYANYCGNEGAFAYCGGSCICGPDGHDIARAGDQPSLTIGAIDRADLDRVRADIAYLNDRRPDIYDRTEKT